jgi:hypothetical protein
MPEATGFPVRCGNCRHHYVTWDARLPWGCRFFDIKTRRPPDRAVKASSGLQCQGFDARKPGGGHRLDGPSDPAHRADR